MYGSPEFMAAYETALAAQRQALAGNPAPVKGKPHKGSLRWLCDRWRESSSWDGTAKSTQKQRENILWHILEGNGHMPFSAIAKADIVAGRERRMATPFAANNYLKTMKALFAWALDADLIAVNPAADVKPLSRATDGHEPWTADDVQKYRARHAIGTRARLAMELLYATGLRRGDAVRLGRQHIGRDGIGRIRTEKTGDEAIVIIGVEMAQVIAESPTGDLAFICGENGKPLAKESFGTIFREWCRDAGIIKSAHGLRKLVGAEIATGGGSEDEIAAALSHRDKASGRIYTRSAKQEALAIQAAGKRNMSKSIPAQNSMIPARKNPKGKSA